MELRVDIRGFLFGEKDFGLLISGAFFAKGALGDLIRQPTEATGMGRADVDTGGASNTFAGIGFAQILRRGGTGWADFGTSAAAGAVTIG